MHVSLRMPISACAQGVQETACEDNMVQRHLQDGNSFASRRVCQQALEALESWMATCRHLVNIQHKQGGSPVALGRRQMCCSSLGALWSSPGAAQ